MDFVRVNKFCVLQVSLNQGPFSLQFQGAFCAPFICFAVCIEGTEAVWGFSFHVPLICHKKKYQVVSELSQHLSNWVNQLDDQRWDIMMMHKNNNQFTRHQCPLICTATKTAMTHKHWAKNWTKGWRCCVTYHTGHASSDPSDWQGTQSQFDISTAILKYFISALFGSV